MTRGYSVWQCGECRTREQYPILESDEKVFCPDRKCGGRMHRDHVVTYTTERDDTGELTR